MANPSYLVKVASNGARASVEARRRRGQALGDETNRLRRSIGAPPSPFTTIKPYGDDESEFIAAMASYIERTGNRFPSWSEALAVARSLGYRKG